MREFDNSLDIMKIFLQSKYTLVDFSATWCGPCKMLSPILDQLSETFTEVQFLKVDIDTYYDLASNYHIQSLPTVMIFDMFGLPVKEFVGLNPKSVYQKFLETL
jgi:thioredoxin 1